MNDDYFNEDNEMENLWLICLNCEYEMSMDDCFFDYSEDNLSDEAVECPVCKSKQMRMERSFEA